MNETKAKYFLKVEKSKAIYKAGIALDSITVLSGVNASGKSTLARMIHQIVNLSGCYPRLLEKMSWEPVKTWADQIVLLDKRLEKRSEGTLSAFGAACVSMQFEGRLGEGKFGSVLNELTSYTRGVLSRYQQRAAEGDAKRAFSAFVRAVGIGDDLVSDVEAVYGVFVKKCDAALQKYTEKLANREYEAYNYASSMKYDIRWLTDAESVCFAEDGEPVYAVHKSKAHKRLKPDANLKEIFGLRESFYIASPWVGLPRLEKDGRLTIKYDDFSHFSNENMSVEATELFDVLAGTIDADDSTGENRWIYHQKKDDKRIDLNDCATGIKALSILNILYTRGYLNSETLLIIDEPEAHLHPQWVVEYARILVLIAKRLKVRMLLTSHNPDMVAALQEISEAEHLEGVRFYLAEQKSPTDGYEYRSLGMDVEPIFKAFNKAIERLDAYEPKQETP